MKSLTHLNRGYTTEKELPRKFQSLRKTEARLVIEHFVARGGDLVHLVYLVSLVSLVLLNKRNNINQTN